MGRWKEGIGGPVSTMGELPVVAVGALKNRFIPCGAWRLLVPHPSSERKTGVISGGQPFCQEVNGKTSTFPACLRL